MKWIKKDNRFWIAEGNSGTFTITQVGRTFWAKYSSTDKTFRLPPKSKLSLAKDICERNVYWEWKDENTEIGAR